MRSSCRAELLMPPLCRCGPQWPAPTLPGTLRNSSWMPMARLSSGTVGITKSPTSLQTLRHCCQLPHKFAQLLRVESFRSAADFCGLHSTYLQILHFLTSWVCLASAVYGLVS